MTATRVNGLAVVADEAAESPLPKRPDGSPVLYKRMRRLLLEDGSEVFGCALCDLTGELAVVRMHLKVHAEPKQARPRVDLSDLMDLARRLQAVDRIQADRDEWRDRALKAEGELRKLRKALEAVLPTVTR